MKSIITSFVGFSTILSLCWAGLLSAEDKTGDSLTAKPEMLCGHYCLASVLNYLGRNVQLNGLFAVAPAEQGTNLAQLKTFAEAYGVKTLGARVTTDMVFAMRRPAILHVNGNHFIALLPNKEDPNFTVIDPPQTFAITNAKDLTAKWKWKGNCLLIDEEEMVLPDPDAKPGAPRITVDNPVFDAGLVFDDAKMLEHEYRITNKGKADLVISEVKSSCRCVTAIPDKKTILAGESILLPTAFRFGGRFGNLVQRTVLTTNDPKTPKTVLTIRAERRRQFTADPPSANMGWVPMGTDKILVMRITPGAEDKKLKIDEATISSPFIQVTEIKNEVDAGNSRQYLLKMHLLADAPPGVYDERVRIPCVGTSYEMLQIPVRAEVLARIQTSLSEVQFGLISPDEKDRTRKIHLRSDKAFELTNVTADRPWLEAACEKVNDSQHFLVVTIVPGVAPKGRLEGAVTVDTTMKEMSTVRIPVFAFRL
ncbi:MAG TPA: DUF1573 domain-containing protein [Sedimentisphaerales bacterium]|nr:DUF1573 domain-containing protein [Sedimentisphaerales bacterium]